MPDCPAYTLEYPLSIHIEMLQNEVSAYTPEYQRSIYIARLQNEVPRGNVHAGISGAYTRV